MHDAIVRAIRNRMTTEGGDRERQLNLEILNSVYQLLSARRARCLEKLGEGEQACLDAGFELEDLVLDFQWLVTAWEDNENPSSDRDIIREVLQRI